MIIDKGQLVLYWTRDGVDQVRTFSREETGVLLNVLLGSRDEIYI